jgi:flavin-dependent dehydrogenase
MGRNQSVLDRQSAFPVILGTGLTGVAISRSLSAAGIRHVLIGAPPGDKPRLGESMNTEGSLEIARQFSDFQQFFFPKQRQALFFGGNTIAFDSIQYAAGRAYYPLLGYPPTVQLLHVDRLGFDRAVFAAAIADNHCVHLDDKTTGLDYDPPADRINGVHLASGRTVPSTFVFDATNQACVVARMAGVRCLQIGNTRRVVFAHYASSTQSAGSPLPAWMNATSLLRLYAGKDPVEGLAWCIPLGNYVSIGVSVDPRQTAADGQALLDWTERALAARGINVREAFPSRGNPIDAQHEHYNHERCFGRNWLLAGASCCQIWFPSSSGVAMGLVAARLAVDVLRAPDTVPPLYQAYIDQVAGIHSGLEWLVRDDPATVTAEVLQRRAEAMSTANLKRLGEYLSFQSAPAELAFGDAVRRLFESDRRPASPVRVESAPKRAQATRMFAAPVAPDPWTESPIEVTVLTRPEHLPGPLAIQGVIDLLSGRLEPDASTRLITPDVTLGIDHFQLQGEAQWNAWLAALRGSQRVSKLELVAGSLTASGSDWVLIAQWQGVIGGQPSVSPQFTITFTLNNGRVSNIQTQRSDYTFVLGDAILPGVAFATMVGRFKTSPSQRLSAQ